MKRRILAIVLGLLVLAGCGPTTTNPQPTPGLTNLQKVEAEAKARGYVYDTIGYGAPQDGRHGTLLFVEMPSMRDKTAAHGAWWEITEAGEIHIGCFNADGYYGVDDFLKYPDEWQFFISNGFCQQPRGTRNMPTTSA